MMSPNPSPYLSVNTLTKAIERSKGLLCLTVSDYSLYSGRLQLQELEPAGHVTPLVKKQEVRNACMLVLSLLLYIVQDHLPRE